MTRTLWFCAAILLCGCNPQPGHAAASSAPSPSSVPALQITGHGAGGKPVLFEGQSGNRKLYRLVAHSYVSHSAQNIQATFAEPTVTFYDKDGTKMTAQAPSARLQAGRQVILTGGVHAKTSTGLDLHCDQLTYDQRSGMLHGQGHVRITGVQGGQQQVLTGNTFTSDVKLTQMVMK